jgi:Mg-chelatase subunit ChlD
MSIKSCFEGNFRFEKSYYDPEISNNICTRLTVNQKLKSPEGEYLSNDETINYMRSNRSKTSTCIILDKSLSMEGEPLDNAKKVIMHFVQNILRPDDIFTLITFNDTATIDINNLLVGDNIEYILTQISMINAYNSTNIPDAIQLALETMSVEKEGYSSNIILFTDGYNTLGPNSCNDIESYLNDINEIWFKTRINCCAFSEDVDLKTINMISQKSESKVVIIKDSESIIPNFIDMFMNLIHETSLEILLRFEHKFNLPHNIVKNDLKEIYKTDKIQKYKLPKCIIGEDVKINVCFEEITSDFFNDLVVNLEIHDVKHQTSFDQNIELKPNFDQIEFTEIDYNISIDLLEIEYNVLMQMFNNNNKKAPLKNFLKKCQNLEIPIDNIRFKNLINNLKQFNKETSRYTLTKLSMQATPGLVNNLVNETNDSPLRTMSSNITSQII